MKDKQNKINRRGFLKTIGAAGLAPAFAGVTKAEPNVPAKTQKTKYPQVPKRKLGKTGIKISCLAIGGGVDYVNNQILLRRAYQWGINFWDTCDVYVGGKSEIGIGKYLAKNPEIRKKLFLSTRAFDGPDFVGPNARGADDVEKRLQRSLKRMNTSYIDLYGIHAISDPSELTDELKDWVKSAKKRKLIRFFGFSTHKNIPKVLHATAKMGWIDAVMTMYNYRLMHDSRMPSAVDACHKASIGLIAMKIQAFQRRKEIDSPINMKVIEHFTAKGFTEGQAKLKVVLQDKRFSSACVGMENIALLTSNVAAVLDKTKLTQADKDVFRQYAEATCSGYCAGCAEICDSVLPDTPYISDIARYLMYYNSYGDRNRARELFAKIPRRIRNKLLSIDYSVAEARCPQHIPIAELVAEAVDKLA
ncbi:MAG: aldo/keto reductase [Planctomycetota bacterium]|jgi:aryl-alcohol dehydrogenase-like predicted oxidoreductase